MGKGSKNNNFHNKANPSLKEGILLHQSGSFFEAQKIYEKIISKEPQNLEVLQLLAISYIQNHHYQKGLEYLNRLIKIDPKHQEALNNRASLFKLIGKVELAVQDYRTVLRIDPFNKAALKNYWSHLKQIGIYDEALLHINNYIQHYGEEASSLSEKAFLLNALGRKNEAIVIFQRVLKIDPESLDSYNNLGILYQEMDLLEEAEKAFLKAIQINPNISEIYNNLGTVYYKNKHYSKALDQYQKAIQMRPEFGEAHYNLGVVYTDLKEYDLGIQSFNQAIYIEPKSATSHNNLGNLYKNKSEFQLAIKCYIKAIEIQPDYASPYNNLGVTYQGLWDYSSALKFYDKALVIDPNYQDALSNRADLYKNLKMYQQAINDFDRVLAINPMKDYCFGTKRFLQMSICEWASLESDMELIRNSIVSRHKLVQPFITFGLFDSLSLQKECAIAKIDQNYPADSSLGPLEKYTKRQKIKIAYFSADFHNHATTYLMAELFELHDRTQFELFAFSFGPVLKDEMRTRISQQFDFFYEVGGISDLKIAELSRSLQIDIAIDLKGHTADARMGIFSYRAAPIQVNYLGYPGTSGAEYIDYLIADQEIVPEYSQNGYTEKIVYLPNSYQVNDTKRQISDLVLQRSSVGLPESSFVFCSFNNSYKIMPKTFEIWMNILKNVDKSVLWLLADNELMKENIHKEAQRLGVIKDRIIFSSRQDLPDHLARHRLADMFLDTWPCNAHTTCSDALWVGLPVLTLIGESFASRVGASLLKAIGLEEMIMHTPEAYQIRAIELGNNPNKVKIIKEKLMSNISSAPLFDIHLYVRHIEMALRKMYEIYQNDQPPQNIYPNDYLTASNFVK